ncbi:MAG: DUF3530 family protein [Betaproteobacteria bacterium]|nr:DUF3530 family protein [Betaproteobacteria bacterium]
MRTFIVFLTLLAACQFALAADYGREKRWADEILPAILDGDTVWLDQANGHKFLGLYLGSAQARGAVILVHGMGVHPDWGINGVMRARLAEQGYATFSIQMPVQAANAKPGDYVKTFPEGNERIAKAAAWLQGKGHARIAIVSHSLGGRMTRAYFLAQKTSPVQAWAALSMGFDDFKGITVPVLDLYAERDHEPVLKMLPAHEKTLKHPASVQRMVAGTSHFYEDKEAEAVKLVREWLDKAL